MVQGRKTLRPRACMVANQPEMSKRVIVKIDFDIIFLTVKNIRYLTLRRLLTNLLLC